MSLFNLISACLVWIILPELQTILQTLLRFVHSIYNLIDNIQMVYDYYKNITEQGWMSHITDSGLSCMSCKITSLPLQPLHTL